MCPGNGDEPHGTSWQGQHASGERIVRVSACRAAGLGLRGTARGGALAPKTMRSGLVAATEQRQACALYLRKALPLKQGQLDALYAIRNAVRDGQV